LPSSNGVELVASGVNADIKADFSYKYWITVTGKADIHIKSASFDAEVNLETQKVKDEVAPKLNA